MTAPVAALRALAEKAEYQRNHDARPDGRTHCAACLTNNEHQEIVDALPALLRRLDRAEAVVALVPDVHQTMRLEGMHATDESDWDREDYGFEHCQDALCVAARAYRAEGEEVGG